MKEDNVVALLQEGEITIGQQWVIVLDIKLMGPGVDPDTGLPWETPERYEILPDAPSPGDGPKMPSVTVDIDRGLVGIPTIYYKFVIGNPKTKRAIEYEDAPSAYNHPYIIYSHGCNQRGQPEDEWPIDWNPYNNDIDVYGGHLTHITVQAYHRIGFRIFQRTYEVNVSIVGVNPDKNVRNAYIDTLDGYPESYRTIAKSIAAQESNGDQFWRTNGVGRARYPGYPLLELDPNGSGFGMMQLTDRQFHSRSNYWNWRSHIAAAMERIKQCYIAGENHLNRYPAGVTDLMLRLEAYNKYNGGLGDRYYWYNSTARPALGLPTAGWIKFGYIPQGTNTDGYRDYNNDGQKDPNGNPYGIPNWRGIYENKVTGRAARYADQCVERE